MVRVLSIDDSRSVHAFITELLKGIPNQLHHAYDGIEGLETLKQKQNEVDIVLLDWEMPKLDGIDTLKKIRESGISTPVVMLTSKNAIEEIREALVLGANEYIMKPFTRDILVEKLESVLGRSLA